MIVSVEYNQFQSPNFLVLECNEISNRLCETIAHNFSDNHYAQKYTFIICFNSSTFLYTRGALLSVHETMWDLSGIKWRGPCHVYSLQAPGTFWWCMLLASRCIHGNISCTLASFKRKIWPIISFYELPDRLHNSTVPGLETNSCVFHQSGLNFKAKLNIYPNRVLARFNLLHKKVSKIRNIS